MSLCYLLHSCADPHFTVQEQSTRWPLILILGFIHDVSDFLNKHPRGHHLLVKNIGKDWMTVFFGGVYDHLNTAHNVYPLSLAFLHTFNPDWNWLGMEQLVMKRVGILSRGHPNPLPNHCQTLPSVPPHQTLPPYCNPITHPQTPAPPLFSSPAHKHPRMWSLPCPPPCPLYSPCYHSHTTYVGTHYYSRSNTVTCKTKTPPHSQHQDAPHPPTTSNPASTTWCTSLPRTLCSPCVHSPCLPKPLSSLLSQDAGIIIMTSSLTPPPCMWWTMCSSPCGLSRCTATTRVQRLFQWHNVPGAFAITVFSASTSMSYYSSDQCTCGF